MSVLSKATKAGTPNITVTASAVCQYQCTCSHKIKVKLLFAHIMGMFSLPTSCRYQLANDPLPTCDTRVDLRSQRQYKSLQKPMIVTRFNFHEEDGISLRSKRGKGRYLFHCTEIYT